jgi:glycopeptide antibiotics resistance protein
MFFKDEKSSKYQRCLLLLISTEKETKKQQSKVEKNISDVYLNSLCVLLKVVLFIQRSFAKDFYRMGDGKVESGSHNGIFMQLLFLFRCCCLRFFAASASACAK